MNEAETRTKSNTLIENLNCSLSSLVYVGELYNCDTRGEHRGESDSDCKAADGI